MADIPITVQCQEHGRELKADVTVVRGDVIVDVEPCSQCTDEAWENGVEEGKKETE